MVALTMGFQSMIFYTMVAWVPSILMDRGIDPNTAGYLLMLSLKYVDFLISQLLLEI
jgi:CP family cyanate transporter-like MFS transporter